MYFRYLLLAAIFSYGANANERALIDARSHLDSDYLEQLTTEDIIERLDRNQIDRILITSRNNNETLKLAYQNASRLFPIKK